eukprot:164613-Rhodomonas_salina.1
MCERPNGQGVWGQQGKLQSIERTQQTFQYFTPKKCTFHLLTTCPAFRVHRTCPATWLLAAICPRTPMQRRTCSSAPTPLRITRT